MSGLPRLRVLGPLEVSVEGEVRAVGGRRACLVLAALVARSASFASIEVLVEDVWGDEAPRSARNALQTYVSRLRAVVAPCPILFQGGGYRLTLGTDDLDALVFEAWSREGRRARERRDWADALARLDQAADLWRGPAFAGLLDVEPAAAWATRLEDALVEVREAAAGAILALGRAEEAAARLESLAQLHPWRERLWGSWALALYRQDRQADALEVLARLRRGLADELGLRPTADIERLELAILRHDPRATLDVADAAGRVDVGNLRSANTELPDDLNTLRGLPIVGRTAALDALGQRWDEARGGRSQAVVVTGEAGIGKSRLAAELAHAVAGDGGAVLYGRASERIDLAYQPFAHALRGVAPEALADIGEAASWLGAVRPTESLLDAGVAALQGVDDRQSRLFEAVGRLLEAAAAPTGLLLVLDDLHCATDPTLGLLEHVLTVARPARLLVLATVRDTDLADRPVVTEFLSDLRRRAAATTVALDGLGVGDVDTLLCAAGLPATPDEAQRVWEQTAGNPLLVTELAVSAGSGLTGALARTPTVPASVAGLIADRARRLGDHGEVLSWAALIGVDFELDVIEAVAGTEAGGGAGTPDVLERLEEAVHAGLVREVGPGRWQFRHGLTAEALQAGIGPTRLAVRHEAIADALASLLPHDVAIGRVAHHRCLAARPGRTTAAIDASLQAARLRLEQVAPGEALDLVGGGLAVLALDGHADPAREAELHLAAGEAHQQLFDEPARVAAADAALAAAHRSGSAVLLARAALLRSSFWTQGQTDPDATAALEAAMSALAASAPEHDAVARQLRSQLLAHLAGSRAVSGAVTAADTGVVVGQAEEAVRLARAGTDQYTRLLAESTLAITLYSGPCARRQLDLAEGMARGNGHLGPMCAARWAAPARLALGDRRGFERDAATLCDEGVRHGVRSMHAFGLQCRALLALLDGRFDSAQAVADEAVAAARGHENFTRVRLAQQLWVAAEQGTLASIEPAARALVGAGGPPVFEAMLGFVLCATGGHGEAAAILAYLARDDWAQVPRDILWLTTVVGCAEIAAWVGATHQAAGLEALLSPYAGQLVVVAGSAFVHGAVDRFRAMLAYLQGDDETAHRLFASAIDLERRIGGAPVELRSRIWRSRLLGDDRNHDGHDLAGLVEQARRLGLGWVDEALPPAAVG